MFDMCMQDKHQSTQTKKTLEAEQLEAESRNLPIKIPIWLYKGILPTCKLLFVRGRRRGAWMQLEGQKSADMRYVCLKVQKKNLKTPLNYLSGFAETANATD